MKMKQRLLIAASTIGLVAGGYTAYAVSTTGNASVTAAPTMSLAQTTAMSFGTVTAEGDGASAANLVLSPAGALTRNDVGTAYIVPMGGLTAQQGVFDVTNAANNTAVNITFGGATTLTNATDTFDLDTFTTDQPADVGTTDGLGALTFNVGATLKTQAAKTGVYDTATALYAGTYSVSVNY